MKRHTDIYRYRKNFRKYLWNYTLAVMFLSKDPAKAKKHFTKANKAANKLSKIKDLPADAHTEAWKVAKRITKTPLNFKNI